MVRESGCKDLLLLGSNEKLSGGHKLLCSNVVLSYFLCRLDHLGSLPLAIVNGLGLVGLPQLDFIVRAERHDAWYKL
jgi:hypothetical protein